MFVSYISLCRLAEDREIVLFCDFHGHSRKQNVFIYGCDSMDNPLTRLKSRVFPKMLSKNAADMFTFKGSSFGVHKSKVSDLASLYRYTCTGSVLPRSYYLRQKGRVVLRQIQSI